MTLFNILMYFFLSNLSFIDVCHSTVTVPKMLIDTWSEEKLISFDACVTQMFFLHLFACTEIFLLTVMAYDRYVAICKPLQYTAIMSQCVCDTLVKLAWVGTCIHSSAQILLALKLPFCGSNAIDHYFCDIFPLLKIACTYITGVLVTAFSGMVALVTFAVLFVSYGIILFILNNVKD